MKSSEKYKMEKQCHNLATLMIKQLGLQPTWRGLDATSASMAWTCSEHGSSDLLCNDPFPHNLL
jgi:hypothetical protein